MNLIKLCYQSISNFFVQKDGFNSFIPILSSSIMLLFVLMVILLPICIINLLIDNLIVIEVNKPFTLLGISVVLVLNYLLIFNVLGIEKYSANEDHLFEVDEEKYNKVIKLMYAMLFIFPLLIASYLWKAYEGM